MKNETMSDLLIGRFILQTNYTSRRTKPKEFTASFSSSVKFSCIKNGQQTDYSLEHLVIRKRLITRQENYDA